MRRFVVIAILTAFLAFEITRFAEASRFLLPMWKAEAEALSAMAAQPLWIASPSLAVTVIAFILPMAGVVFLLRWAHRRLSRNGTPVNILLTKLNLR